MESRGFAGAVQTEERFLSCVNSQVPYHVSLSFRLHTTDQTLERIAFCLYMGVETLLRLERQSTVGAPACLVAVWRGF